jgi:hypothetical protein
MKKVLLYSIALGFVIVLSMSLAYAQKDDAAATTDQLCSELQKSGTLTQEELDGIKRPLKDMAVKGANKKDLKRTLTDLSNKGIKGKDLKDAINAMNDLVKNGERPKDAGNIVSQAARQAHLEGLKGKDLAARVHEAIRQRKQERMQLMKQKRLEEQTSAGTAKNPRVKLIEKGIKQQKSMPPRIKGPKSK